MKLQVVLDVIPIYFRFYVWGLNTLSWHKRSQVGPLHEVGGALAMVPLNPGRLRKMWS